MLPPVLAASYAWNLPGGPVIILIAGTTYLAVVLVKKIHWKW